MRKFFSSWVGRVALLAAVAVSVYFINVEVQSYWGQQAVEATGLQSHTLPAALAKAGAENKLVIVDVSAIWCPNCRRLDNQVFADEGVKKVINDRFVFSRLEYESPEGTAFLEEHKASGFPTLWLLDATGKVVKKLNVVFEPEAFIRQLPKS